MSTKYYLVRKANGVAFGKLRRYQSNNVSDKLKSVCDEISVGIYIGDMTPGGFFLSISLMISIIVLDFIEYYRIYIL